MCVYVHKYIHIYTYIYTNVCIDVSYHACVHACMHACIHACIHTYIHTYIHACTHTYICARSLARVQQVWKAKGDACGVTLHDLVEAGLALFAALAECKAEDGVLAQLGRVAFVPGVHPLRVPLHSRRRRSPRFRSAASKTSPLPPSPRCKASCGQVMRGCQRERERERERESLTLCGEVIRGCQRERVTLCGAPGSEGSIGPRGVPPGS